MCLLLFCVNQMPVSNTVWVFTILIFYTPLNFVTKLCHSIQKKHERCIDRNACVYWCPHVIVYCRSHRCNARAQSEKTRCRRKWDCLAATEINRQLCREKRRVSSLLMGVDNDDEQCIQKARQIGNMQWDYELLPLIQTFYDQFPAHTCLPFLSYRGSLILYIWWPFASTSFPYAHKRDDLKSSAPFFR